MRCGAVWCGVWCGVWFGEVWCGVLYSTMWLKCCDLCSAIVPLYYYCTAVLHVVISAPLLYHCTTTILLYYVL